MLITLIAIYLLFASACAVLSYGILNACFKNKWPSIYEKEDIGDCLLFAILVFMLPLLFVVIYFRTGSAQYGLDLSLKV